MSYGVEATGFKRKPASLILTEIQDQMIAVYGTTNIIQTPQSPLGQLNGLMTDIISELWERLEDVYQSYDPNQAEGNRLDDLASIRLMMRTDGELDEAYRLRITNESLESSDLSALESAVASVSGVTFVRAYANEGEANNEYGMPPHNLAVAVVGGSDAAVAQAIRAHSVEGLSTWGSSHVQAVDPDGYARTINFTRPALTPIAIDVIVTRTKALRAPAVPTYDGIKALIIAGLSGPNGLLNGERISPSRIANLINVPGLEVVEVRVARAGDRPLAQTLALNFDELPLVTEENLQILWSA